MSCFTVKTKGSQPPSRQKLELGGQVGMAMSPPPPLCLVETKLSSSNVRRYSFGGTVSVI